MTFIRAYLLGVGLVLFMDFLGRTNRFDVFSDNPKPWVNWLQSHWLRWVVKGIAAGIVGITIDVWFIPWIHSTATKGVFGLLYVLLSIVIGVGIGVSLGKHLTETDYSAFENHTANRTSSQFLLPLRVPFL